MFQKQSKNMKKIFSKIHLWLSIPVGIIISLICLTGAILVFNSEISETLHPHRYFVDKVESQPLALDKLISTVNAQLGDSTAVESIQTSSDPKRNYTISLNNGKRESLYVNPYNGKIVESFNYMDSFFGKVMSLHRWLLFGSKDWGKSIVGYSTLLFVFILISGIVIWWPKSRNQLKNRLTVNRKHGAKRFFYDLHSSLGIYVTIGLLTLALTGLTWSFDWYRQGFYAVFGVKTEQGKPGHDHGGKGKEAPESKPIDYSQWQTAADNVKSMAGEYKSFFILDGNIMVSPLHAYGNSMKADMYSFDSQTGKITNVNLYANSKPSDKIRGWILSVHVGAWGGLTTKIITFLIALFGATLPWTGYYIFYFKRKKKWLSK